MQIIDPKKGAPTFHSTGTRDESRRKPSVAESRERRERVLFWLRVAALVSLTACLLLVLLYGSFAAEGLFRRAIEVLAR